MEARTRAATREKEREKEEGREGENVYVWCDMRLHSRYLHVSTIFHDFAESDATRHRTKTSSWRHVFYVADSLSSGFLCRGGKIYSDDILIRANNSSVFFMADESSSERRVGYSSRASRNAESSLKWGIKKLRNTITIFSDRPCRTLSKAAQSLGGRNSESSLKLLEMLALIFLGRRASRSEVNTEATQSPLEDIM